MHRGHRVGTYEDEEAARAAADAWGGVARPRSGRFVGHSYVTSNFVFYTFTHPHSTFLF